MIMAAGFGTRMGALTAHRPKALIPVAGRPLLDHALGVADGAGIVRRVVNTHYLGDQIAAYLAGRDIEISVEQGEILETGGGLRHAMPTLGTNPVLVLNSDCIFTGRNPLTELLEAWDDARMDGLLLLQAGTVAQRNLPDDFFLSPDGRLARANGASGHVYLGAQILRTDDLHAIPEKVFSLNKVWDRMIARGRLYGIVHQGGWCDVGRPEGIAKAEALIAGSPDV
jgi:N-acetyl-alpha-D-muramate 1-phosphate uridylyltransferase